MDQLRKYIQEAIKVIGEDYESIKQVNTLANDVLSFAGKVNVEYVIRQIKDGNIEGNRKSLFLYPVKLLDIYQEKSKNYPVLQDFLTNSNILVQFIRSSNKNRRGSYTWTNDADYDTTKNRSIYLYYDEEELFINLDGKLKDSKKLDSSDIYFSFWYKFASTLEHELQHAYDDYRSNSNIFRAKKSQKYDDKYILPSGKEMEFDDPIKQGYKYKEYLNLQHEIWARFTQTISKIRFSTIDFKETEDGRSYLNYKMKSLDEAIKNFRYEFSGWQVLSEKMKKKLVGKVSQFWHKEQEALPEKNKAEIEKLNNKKSEMSLAEVRKIIIKTIKDLI